MTPHPNMYVHDEDVSDIVDRGTCIVAKFQYHFCISFDKMDIAWLLESL